MSRLFILLAVMLALDAYAFLAFRSWLSKYSPATRRVAFVFYWALSALSFAFILLNVLELNEGWSDGLKVYSRAVVFILYLSKVPVAFFLLIDDLRRGITWIINRISPVTERDTSRSRFLSKTALVAGGVPLVTLTYGMVRNAYRYRRFAVDVPVTNLPEGLEGFRIVQISDMHSGSWTRTEPLKEAVRMINEEEGDIVVFTGDIVNNRADEMEPYIDIFKEVRGKHGVYSILGNHDYGDYVPWNDDREKENNMQRVYAVHERLCWDLLRDEHRKLKINGSTLG
ncbi:MAG: metallophosphoesterase, partial [Lewinella sp.]